MFSLSRNTVVRGIAMAITLCTASQALASNAPQACPTLSDRQVDILKQSYALGEPHDLGYTLAAIALKESSAGLFLINAMTSDYGIFQGNVRTVCTQAGVYHNDFQCNLEIQRVVSDINTAAKHAIETLSYWRNYHSKRSEHFLVYENMIRSYNGGFNFEHVDEYWEAFRDDFYTVKQCVDFNT